MYTLIFKFEKYEFTITYNISYNDVEIIQIFTLIINLFKCLKLVSMYT